MEPIDRSTPPLAVLLMALLTAATIGLSALVVMSAPANAVAAATATPAPSAGPTISPTPGLVMLVD
jgi:hypothetical protein